MPFAASLTLPLRLFAPAGAFDSGISHRSSIGPMCAGLNSLDACRRLLLHLASIGRRRRARPRLGPAGAVASEEPDGHGEPDGEQDRTDHDEDDIDPERGPRDVAHGLLRHLQGQGRAVPEEQVLDPRIDERPSLPQQRCQRSHHHEDPRDEVVPGPGPGLREVDRDEHDREAGQELVRAAEVEPQRPPAARDRERPGDAKADERRDVLVAEDPEPSLAPRLPCDQAEEPRDQRLHRERVDDEDEPEERGEHRIRSRAAHERGHEELRACHPGCCAVLRGLSPATTEYAARDASARRPSDSIAPPPTGSASVSMSSCFEEDELLTRLCHPETAPHAMATNRIGQIGPIVLFQTPTNAGSCNGTPAPPLTKGEASAPTSRRMIAAYAG